jgi:rare lipoprotein A
MIAIIQFRSAMLRLTIPLLLLLLVAACSDRRESPVSSTRATPPPFTEGTEITVLEPGGFYKVGSPYRIRGVLYRPNTNYAYDQVGVASWYGPGFHGKKTANGEIFDTNALTAAHPTLPMPSLVRVTHRDHGRSVVVRINDRGPFASGRIIDLSQRAAEALDMIRNGTAPVRVQILERESRLMAARAQSVSQPGGVPARVTMLLDGRATGEPPLPAAAPMVGVIQQSLGGPPTLSTAANAHPPGADRQIYIQLGSFANRDNARRLAETMSDLGRVQVDSKMVGDVRYQRVLLGPFTSQDAADARFDEVRRRGLIGAQLVLL